MLEYRPKGSDSDFRWDAEGWSGGDYNRLWFKSEGERNTALKADCDLDLQLLYGRFVSRYYDFQIGTRVETQTFQGRNVTRAHAVIGLEGLVPYRYEFQPSLFISQNGDVPARITLTREFLITQRLILQPRFETYIAAQRVERFTTGSGLNNIEFGLRLRYEIRRQFAPYFGVSFDRSFFGTADLVRRMAATPAKFASWRVCGYGTNARQQPEPFAQLRFRLGRLSGPVPRTFRHSRPFDRPGVGGTISSLVFWTRPWD